MFKNYFKIAVRNLLRYKLYSFINISGLAVGMFCFLCIFLWVKYEKSYDRFYPDYQNLYQVIYEYHGAGGSVQRVSTHAAALGPALQDDYPEIKNVARTCFSSLWQTPLTSTCASSTLPKSLRDWFSFSLSNSLFKKSLVRPQRVQTK